MSEHAALCRNEEIADSMTEGKQRLSAALKIALMTEANRRLVGTVPPLNSMALGVDERMRSALPHRTIRRFCEERQGRIATRREIRRG